MESSQAADTLPKGQTSPSAVRVAIARAVHQLLDEPVVFNDPWALSILGKPLEQAVRDDPFQFNDPAARTMRAAVVARNRLAEDTLQSSVSRGIKQYVVLGAGLDTFSLRNPYQANGLLVFEVDQPTMQEQKLKTLQDTMIAVPAASRFVSVDFESDSLEDRLRQAGFSTDEPTCFSWLGVTAYLTNAAVLETLSFVARLPKGSSITFDYRIPATLLGPVERMMEELGSAMFAAMNEPWISSFDPAALRKQLIEMGFAHFEAYGPAELNARYFPKRKDGLQTGGGGFRLLCAHV